MYGRTDGRTNEKKNAENSLRKYCWQSTQLHEFGDCSIESMVVRASEIRSFKGNYAEWNTKQKHTYTYDEQETQKKNEILNYA